MTDLKIESRSNPSVKEIFFFTCDFITWKESLVYSPVFTLPSGLIQLFPVLS